MSFYRAAIPTPTNRVLISPAASIKQATRIYAEGLMSYYKGNASGLSKEDIGVFPKPPYYWWEAGAAWGALIEYTQLTGDHSYVPTLHQALVTNYGPDGNLILDWKRDQEVGFFILGLRLI